MKTNATNSGAATSRDKSVVVYTVGTFDLVHVGHLALLRRCRELGDVVAVGVASDRVVHRYKPNLPVIPLEQRQEMLKALRYVDVVRPYHELEYVSACKALDIDVFVVGEDWGAKPHNLEVEAYLQRNGKRIVRVLYNPRTSSTTIKRNVIAQFRKSPRVGDTQHVPVAAVEVGALS